MLARRIFVLLVALGTLTFVIPPGGASSDCEAAQSNLFTVIGGSPAELTPEVADALADAIATCQAVEKEGTHIKGGRKNPKEPLPCGGSLERVGSMTVIIAIPFYGTTTYQTNALIDYQRPADALDSMTARDVGLPTTGFDATDGAGVIYVAGVPFPATDAGAEGTCGLTGGVCRATGYANLNAGIQVWMAAQMGACFI
jgi:hypothetical protein